jgi:SNF2-related domain
MAFSIATCEPVSQVAMYLLPLHTINQEFYYSDQFGAKGDAAKLRKLQVTKFDVLITTFEIVMVAKDVLSKIKFRILIVDEAHKLKNHKARIFEELATVPREYCVLLTGKGHATWANRSIGVWPVSTSLDSLRTSPD